MSAITHIILHFSGLGGVQGAKDPSALSCRRGIYQPSLFKNTIPFNLENSWRLRSISVWPLRSRGSDALIYRGFRVRPSKVNGLWLSNGQVLDQAQGQIHKPNKQCRKVEWSARLNATEFFRLSSFRQASHRHWAARPRLSSRNC